jgi:hypothetical protein
LEGSEQLATPSNKRRPTTQITTGSCPFAATIGAEHIGLHCRGDVMTYDARTLIQRQYNLRLQQQGYAKSMRATYYEQTPPRIEMVIGSWYLDEFGNKTREIKARN